ncbi:DMT family transporter [Kerstersia gyiorum]|uniref:Membrane protein n=1 Tax=Kerstersia gyiorum TaxID=206506 RepID=A0A171KPC7_9BURK|nr:DMT family transporter [Kerstersia gyiorum]KKO70744.1 membrane protein [Kerstersia gyiorum]
MTSRRHASPVFRPASPATARLCAHLAALLFGLSAIFGALIHADAVTITFGRALFACLALAAFACWRGHGLHQRMAPRQFALLMITGILLALHWITFFISVKTGGVAMATLGFASFPAFIALLDRWLFRERIGRSESLLLVLVSVGLVLVTPAFQASDQGTIGLLWGVASGFSFALLAAANRRAVHGLPAIQVAFWQNTTVALVLAPFASWGLMRLDGLDWLNLALLGILCTGLAHGLFVASLRGLSARGSGMIIALEPVYAIAGAWWLFGAQPTGRMLAGAALIVSAIVLAARNKAAAPAETAEPPPAP